MSKLIIPEPDVHAMLRVAEARKETPCVQICTLLTCDRITCDVCAYYDLDTLKQYIEQVEDNE